MIKPDEYNNTLTAVRDKLAKYVNEYANLHDLGIQRQTDKLKLIVVNHYYEYLNTSQPFINPITTDDKIEKHVGQILQPILDDTGNIIVNAGATKEYDEHKLYKCIKGVNKILKSSFFINVYPDVYFEYAP